MTKYILFNEKGNFYYMILGLIIHSYNSFKIRIIWIVHIECTRKREQVIGEGPCYL